jgi:hypothetical protein
MEGKEDWFRFGKTIIWVGMMHGHYLTTANDHSDFVEPDGDGREKHQPMHTGISVVVPVAKIVETLNSPSVAKAREKMENEYLAIEGQLGKPIQ